MPVIIFAAGLPQTAKFSGEAKSYAERLFIYSEIGALEEKDAISAICSPLEEQRVEIDQAALKQIIKLTAGYPYFIQEFGYHMWNVAEKSPISFKDVTLTRERVLDSLDNNFFRIRLNRLTPAEIDYVNAMASLGKGSYKSADIAERLKKNLNFLGPRRASIIGKGMIYSPNHGEVDFTVPLFDGFLRRRQSK